MTAEDSRAGFWPSSRYDLEILKTTLAITCLFFLFGTSAYQLLTNNAIDSSSAFLEIWNRWDAVNYVALAEHGYELDGPRRHVIVFLPLFAWCTKALHLVIGNYILSALILSGVTTFSSAWLLYKLARLDYEHELASRAVWYLLIFPTSLFLHVGYADGMFLSFILASFIAARNGRWFLAGVSGALACMTRSYGFLVIPALAAEALAGYVMDRRIKTAWLWALLPVAGSGVYLWLNYRLAGNPFYFLGVYKEIWNKQLTWPWVGLTAKLAEYATRGPFERQMVVTQEFLFVLIGVAGFCVAVKKLRPSYAVWIGANLVFFTSTNFVVSVPRYVLVLFPLYFLFAMPKEKRLWHTVLSVWSLLFLALFTSLYVQSKWAF